MRKVGSEFRIIGQNLRAIREQYGYSQKKIGEILQVTFQQIQKYERGQSRIPVEKLYLLHKFYNVPFAVFFENVEAHLYGPSAELQSLNISVVCSRLQTLRNEALKNKICQVVLILAEEPSV